MSAASAHKRRRLRPGAVIIGAGGQAVWACNLATHELGTYIRRGPARMGSSILPPHRKWSENSALSSQCPHGPPMADPTPSFRVAPPDGTGNPIPERFSPGLAPKKPPPLAPARASGPPKPTTRKGRLRVSIAGREGRPHPRGWLCVCLPDSDGRLRGRACVLSPSHPREMAESTEPHAASPWTQGSDFYRENPICTSVLK